MLTKRQSEVLKFVQSEVANHGYPPTVREIMEHFQFNSPRGATCHLDALEKKGFITRETKMARSIRLTAKARPLRGIPLLKLSDITE